MMKNKVLIIAEAGVNHNGEINLAKQLIDAAVDAGVDYVKFQTFNSKKLVSKFAEKASYQKTNTKDENESQLAMLQKLEMSKEMHFELIDYCRSKNIKFLSTAFDLESVDFLNELNIDLFKIPSGEMTNLPYLRKIGGLGKPVILSTGMGSLEEIGEAMNALIKAGTKKENITILHCNTEYPTPMSDVNLLAMNTIGKTYGVSVGYSDHTLGIEVPIAAVALGATVIEKHFTLDKTMEGPDHIASLEPHELTSMVQSIRNIEKALGFDEKIASASESKNIQISRKSIVASKIIQKGEIFSEENLTVKRPGNGISPMRWDEFIGKIAQSNFSEDELITE
jgi:N,N'-diacetyllegionaminate synthase